MAVKRTQIEGQAVSLEQARVVGSTTCNRKKKGRLAKYGRRIK